jgi:hypothetical protein
MQVALIPVAYTDEGVRLLELSQNVVSLYEKQEMQEKRGLLNFVCSNSQWRDGKSIPTCRKPFALLSTTKHVVHRNKSRFPCGKRLLSTMAPRAGLEPATNWLTANRSTD